MSWTRRGLGHKRDRRHTFAVSPRESLALGLLAGSPTPPAQASNDWQVLDVLDQGGAPFCVAHAVAQALRCNQVWRGVVSPRLASRLWIMYLAHSIDHDVDAFDGTFVRSAFDAVARFGFPPEDAWPYSDSPSGPYRTRPSMEAFREGYDRIAPLDYTPILAEGAERVDLVKRCLASGRPVVFGTAVSDDFCDNVGVDRPLDPPVGGPIAGLHALTLTSYVGDVFRGPNSWGDGWGQRGWFQMTADYLAWSETSDLWMPDFKGVTS